jgi:uncharacterized protein with PIN domain
VGVDVLVLEGEDDESLTVAAVSGADEVVVASVVEHEASFAAVEAEKKGLGCVAGAVVRRAHQQHTVRVLVVDEHCTECDERNNASGACILLHTQAKSLTHRGCP